MMASGPPTRRRLYLDTSAYLCVLLGEEESARLSLETDRAELLSSVVLVLEAQRNLVRLAREGHLNPGDYRTCMSRLTRDTDVFVLRDATLDICRSIQMPAVSTPRSLDLLHLRTALAFHGQRAIDRFLTLDLSQRQAARELGLPV